MNDYISEYNAELDQTKREIIYNTKLKASFEKLVECVYNKHKFPYMKVGSIEIQKECIGHLIMNMGKFLASKGNSFSYFSIVAKNWFVALNNKNYQEFKIHENIDPYTTEECAVAKDHYYNNENVFNSAIGKQLVVKDDNFKQQEMDEFFQRLIDYFERNMIHIFRREDDRRICDAVLTLLRQRKSIELVGHKKSVFFVLREISEEEKTQKITRVLRKMRRYYQQIYKEWVNGIGDGASNSNGFYDRMNPSSLHLTPSQVALN